MPLATPQEGRVRWPEFAHVIFDCDSTLSTVEGIDVLAGQLGFAEEVAALTEAAMEGDVELNAVYAERLQMLQPSKQAINALRAAYKQNVVVGAREVVATLAEVGINVYVVSGGLADPVTDFAVSLGIEPARVRAVEARHDSLSGEWWKAAQGPVDQAFSGFEAGALTRTDGKAEVIGDLLAGATGASLLVGDGASDMGASAAVDLFIGFGGVVPRRAVAAGAPVYVSGASLAPILPMAVGPGGAARITSEEGLATLQAGISQIKSGDVLFKDPEMKQQLLASLDRKQENHV